MHVDVDLFPRLLLEWVRIAEPGMAVVIRVLR